MQWVFWRGGRWDMTSFPAPFALQTRCVALPRLRPTMEYSSLVSIGAAGFTPAVKIWVTLNGHMKLIRETWQRGQTWDGSTQVTVRF